MQGVQPMPRAMPSRGGSRQSDPSAHAWPHGALREPEAADEDHAHDDDERAEDAGDRVGVFQEEPSGGAAEHSHADEHDGESGDEQHHADHNTVPTGRESRGRGRSGGYRGGRGRVVALRVGGAVRLVEVCSRRGCVCRAGCCGGADVAEVAGHQGKDAGGEEGHQSGEHGDRDGDEQGSAGDGVDEGHDSSSVSEMSVLRIEALLSWPMMRAATLPLRSSTIVVGTAFNGVSSANASFTDPSTVARALG